MDFMYIISETEFQQISQLILHLSETFDSAEDETFIRMAGVYLTDLPAGIKRYLFDYRESQDHSGIAIIRGFRGLESLPPTPKSWFLEDSYPARFKTDYLSVLFSAILGEPFGFETQQKGKLIHDIVPIKGREYRQEGSSSLQSLNFHTEDVFHPYRADYLCLVCLRNPSSVGTLVCKIQDLIIPAGIKRILFEKRFIHHPDNTHEGDLKDFVLDSIFFGDSIAPYIRIDYDFTKPAPGDNEAKYAIEYLISEIETKMTEIQILPGDFCFIDNYKVLHGRKAFSALYDGKDRWLRRFNIAVNLRDANCYRSDPLTRMLSFEPFS